LQKVAMLVCRFMSQSRRTLRSLDAPSQSAATAGGCNQIWKASQVQQMEAVTVRGSGMTSDPVGWLGYATGSGTAPYWHYCQLYCGCGHRLK